MYLHTRLLITVCIEEYHVESMCSSIVSNRRWSIYILRMSVCNIDVFDYMCIYSQYIVIPLVNTRTTDNMVH